MRWFLRDQAHVLLSAALRSRHRQTHDTRRREHRQGRRHRALTEAERRADQARYQEVTCRSALNRVKGMPFDWTLNPYRGCTHGCHYCFARRYHVQFEMNADDEFASVILVKHELRRRADARAGSSVVEARARRRRHRDRSATSRSKGTTSSRAAPSRRSLRARTPIGLITKGPMVVRDRDVLARSAGAAAVHRLHQRPDGGRRRLARRSSPARRTRFSGCGRCASWSTPASMPAC